MLGNGARVRIFAFSIPTQIGLYRVSSLPMQDYHVLIGINPRPASKNGVSLGIAALTALVLAIAEFLSFVASLLMTGI